LEEGTELRHTSMVTSPDELAQGFAQGPSAWYARLDPAV
jgi:hypothetical protein